MEFGDSRTFIWHVQVAAMCGCPTVDDIIGGAGSPHDRRGSAPAREGIPSQPWVSQQLLIELMCAALIWLQFTTVCPAF